MVETHLTYLEKEQVIHNTVSDSVHINHAAGNLDELTFIYTLNYHN